MNRYSDDLPYKHVLIPFKPHILFVGTHRLLQVLITDAFSLIQYTVETTAHLERAYQSIEQGIRRNDPPCALILDLSSDKRQEILFLLRCQVLLSRERSRMIIIILTSDTTHPNKDQLGVHYLFQKPFAIRDLLHIFPSLL